MAIATTGDRIGQVRTPAPLPGIDYLVTVQNPRPGADPGEAVPGDGGGRSDIVIRAAPGTGLSRNRNCGLAWATGALVLFSDDDVDLDPDGIAAMRTAFAEDAGLDLALGWRAGTRPVRGRRAGIHRLTRFNAGHACAPEIVVRRDAVLRYGLRFDLRFGVGGAFPSGEDYVFVADLLAAGLRGRGLPVVLGRHDGASTGDDWKDPRLAEARRTVLSRVFGRWSGPVALAYGWRHRRRLGGGLHWLRFALPRRTPIRPAPGRDDTDPA